MFFGFMSLFGGVLVEVGWNIDFRWEDRGGDWGGFYFFCWGIYVGVWVWF